MSSDRGWILRVSTLFAPLFSETGTVSKRFLSFKSRKKLKIQAAGCRRAAQAIQQKGEKEQTN